MRATHCKICGEDLFGEWKYGAKCRDCYNAYHTEWRRRNHERVAAQRKKLYDKMFRAAAFDLPEKMTEFEEIKENRFWRLGQKMGAGAKYED